MKFILFIAIACLYLSCKNEIKNETKPRIPKEYTANQFYDNLSVSGTGFNADETKVLTANNSTGIFNVYEINLADQSTTPVTKSVTESIFPVDYVPGTNEIIYSSDQGGDENAHLYKLKVGDTTAIDLTPWKGSANNFMRWSADKKSMYITSNKRDPRYFDLYKLALNQPTPTLLYQNDSAYDIGIISNSERYLVLIKSITTDKNEMYLYDRNAKSYQRLSNDHEASWYPAVMENNDSILYYTANDGNEYSRIIKYNINSKSATTYFEDKWDVLGMSLSENENLHTLFINEDGKNKLLVFDHKTNQAIPLPGIEDASINNVIISPKEKNLLLSVGSSTSPNNLYNYSLESKKLDRLTNTLNKEIDENDLVKAEIVRFKSFDGLEIPAIYYKPLQATKTNKVGALVWVHGGPGGQSRVGFSNSIQHLVNKGYAVLAVNNRGSSGYGKTFYKMDNRDHGGADLKDCVWGKKWLAQQEYIDTNAIGIYGGSYGGCMVLNALTTYPEEFKLGVNLFGVANWIRTLRSIPPYWESFRKALYDEIGDPYSADSVRIKNISPLYNYQKINKPLIVFQGANDVRVLPIESDEIVAGVKKNGVPVEYVVFKDEGHGFVKKENQITTSQKTLEFLNTHMKVGNKINN